MTTEGQSSLLKAYYFLVCILEDLIEATAVIVFLVAPKN